MKLNTLCKVDNGFKYHLKSLSLEIFHLEVKF